MSESDATEPTPPRRALGRLWVVGTLAAVAFGVGDVVAHARELELRWFEALDVVALHGLVGAVASTLALPVAALALFVTRPLLGLARAAALVFWFGGVAVTLAALELGALNGAVALGVLATVTLVALRAAAIESFATRRGWRTSRRLALLAGVLLLVAPRVGARLARPPEANTSPPRSSGRPDVVLVVLDTQRADHLGAYGDPRGLSPNFDAFAREGALFTSCFSTAPWTVPSHATLFTSLEPPTHGCSFEHHRWLDRRFETLAEKLVACGGYQTAAFAANPWLFRANLLQGFATAEPVGVRQLSLAIRPLLELVGWPAWLADHGATDAVLQVDRFLATQRDGDKPLFLFVNLLEAHWRDLPPLRERIGQTEPEPGLVTATNVSRQFFGPLVMAGKKVDGPLEPSLRALYAAAVQYQDERLGELLAVLRRRLDLDHTVVVVTADHGENLGEGGRFDHVFALNDALLHVPLAIRYPAAFKAATKVDGLCELADVPVTLFELTQPPHAEPFGADVAGRSLLPGEFTPREVVLGFGDPYLGHLEAMARHTGMRRDVLRFAATLRSIRDARQQLVRSTARPDQLFDVVADRDELRDLANEPASRATVDELSRRLQQALDALRPYDGPPRGEPEEALDEPRDSPALRAIGYTHGGDGTR